MPIKNDGTGKRWVEMEVLLPGTPEQVWQAVATGDGYTAWFTRATIEERAGGALRFHFGPDMQSSGEVTIWEPPHRFGYVETEWQEGAPPIDTEIVLTGRPGGGCVMRMVHWMVTQSDHWDDQMESFENGWPGYFDVLRIYLAHFAGMKAASFNAVVRLDGEQLPLWRKLTDTLGLAGANVGERRAMKGLPEAFAGTIERIQQDATLRTVLLRLDTPASGIALIGTCGSGPKVSASVSAFFYGDDAEEKAAAGETLWGEWFARTFTDSTSANGHQE
jgi:uncharacterized protein YndB with AHSA1/START domain